MDLIKSFIVVFMLLLFSISYAEIPRMINYQGMLTDAQNNPLEGDMDIQFLLYDAENDGTLLWEETQTVTVSEGLFHVFLGSFNPIPYAIFDSSEVYLTLQINTDPEMTPRKQLVSTGYAFHANKADSLNGFNPSDFLHTLNQVSPDTSGNIDLVEGSNITISPNANNNRITISASTGSGSGDNLGNHKATMNINTNGHWVSGDGSNKGLKIKSDGSVGINKDPGYALDVSGDIAASQNLHVEDEIVSNGVIRTGSPYFSYDDYDIVARDNLIAGRHITAVDGFIRTGNPTSFYEEGCIVSTLDMIADNWVVAGSSVKAGKSIFTGSPSSTYTDGDIIATKNLIADENVKAGSSIIAGTPSVGYSTGDIVAADDVKAGKNVDALNDVLAESHIVCYSGHIRAGSPGSAYGNGDIAAANDVLADDDITAGDDLFINGIESGSGSQVVITGNKLYSVSSSRRNKENIKHLQDDFEQILKADPKAFQYKDSGISSIGYIAEDLEQLGLDQLLTYENGRVQSIRYDLISVYILEIVKKQQATIQKLEQEIEQLKSSSIQ